MWVCSPLKIPSFPSHKVPIGAVAIKAICATCAGEAVPEIVDSDPVLELYILGLYNRFAGAVVAPPNAIIRCKTRCKPSSSSMNVFPQWLLRGPSTKRPARTSRTSRSQEELVTRGWQRLQGTWPNCGFPSMSIRCPKFVRANDPLVVALGYR